MCIILGATCFLHFDMGCRLGALGVDMFGTKACSKGVPHKHSEHIAYKCGLRGSLNFDMDLRFRGLFPKGFSRKGVPERRETNAVSVSCQKAILGDCLRRHVGKFVV